MIVTITTHPAVLLAAEDDGRQLAPVASVLGQEVATERLVFVTPADASDFTKEVTLLLVALQLAEV